MAWLDRIVLVVMVIHLVACPFTKVEESFNLQAMHDILFHGWNIHEYDHLEFPGVVPRTFIGPLAVSFLAMPMIFLIKFFQMSKYIGQYFVRFDLGLMVFYALLKYKRAVQIRFNAGVAKWLLLICISQFHLMFYMTRPLPNIFAFVLVLLSITWCLRKEYGKFIWTAGFAIIAFRSELAVLMGFILLIELVAKRISVTDVIKIMIPAGVACLSLTMSVDSLFWQRFLWPEGEVFWYNTVLNRSSNWGTMPFLWYFYSALPRALSSTILLVPLGFYLEGKSRSLFLSSFLFVFTYSFLPHKELRFIIYVIPVFNTVAACACQKLWQNRSKSLFKQFLALAVVGHLVVNLITTGCLLCISFYNYPGGWALARLHKLDSSSRVHVHIDVAAAQTGISRFSELKNTWRYDKTEDLEPTGQHLMSADYLLIGASNLEDDSLKPYEKTHEVLHVEYGFSKIRLDLKTLPFIHLITEPKMYVLKRIKKI